MCYATFDAIMREGIIVRCILPATLLVAALIGVIGYFVSKHRHGIASDRSLGFMLVMAAASVFFVIDAASDVLPMMRDLNSQNYTSIHGMYESETRYQMHSSKLLFSVTLDGGEIVGLKRAKPIGIELNGVPLPEGKYMATVWYAAESHCIVAFIPDEPIPED